MKYSPLFFALASLFSNMVAATQASPVGLWQTVDNNTGLPRAEIHITEAKGALTGRISRNLLPQTTPLAELCDKCVDERKGAPLIGMEVLRKAKASSDPSVWEGGEILDPDEGKTYRLRLQMLEDGKKMQVRGYMGPFFKNRTWVRLN
jgi:uncharacterized protein (DUF2147 family)